jgi:tetratricopeptide (TPR) repeat protein
MCCFKTSTLARHTTTPEAEENHLIGGNRHVANAAGVAATALVLFLAAALSALAQAPQADQNKPATQDKPAQQKPVPNPPAQSNPFPEDTNSVPVLPSANTAAAPVPGYTAPPPALPSDDADPVRSPDDPVPSAPSSSSEWSDSASAVPLDRIQPPPDDNTAHGRHKGKDQLEPDVPKETAKEDESVGGLYLDQHDWKGALSRYESAVVLDPENPDVYWGLAEAQRHLGQFAAAKSNYQKVVEYDPDSKHAKEAQKLLKEPDLANAAAPAPPQP